MTAAAGGASCLGRSFITNDTQRVRSGNTSVGDVEAVGTATSFVERKMGGVLGAGVGRAIVRVRVVGIVGAESALDYELTFDSEDSLTHSAEPVGIDGAEAQSIDTILEVETDFDFDSGTFPTAIYYSSQLDALGDVNATVTVSVAALRDLECL